MSNKVYNYLIRFSFLVIGLFSYNQSAAQRSIEKLLHYFYPSAEDYIYIYILTPDSKTYLTGITEEIEAGNILRRSI